MAQCKTHNYSAEEFTWIIARRGCYDAIFHRLLKMIDSSSPVIRGYSQGQVAFYVFRHDLTNLNII